MLAQGRNVAIPVLTPGGDWDGTAGSGAAAPDESQDVLGSGYAEKAICAFDEHRFVHVTGQNHIICVGADIGDTTAGIKEVEFFLEGNSVVIKAQTLRRSVGFAVRVRSSATHNGVANLYAIVRPWNGFERRLLLEVILDTNTGVTRVSRALKYISPAGNDSTGDGSQGNPWKSVLKACLSAGSGAIVEMAAGTYLEDSNTGTLQTIALPIEFRRATGAKLGDVIIDRSSRTLNSGVWQLRATKTIFRGIKIELARIPQINPPNSASIFGIIDGEASDENGETGPSAGYYNPTEAGQILFRDTEGQYNFAIDSLIRNYITTGLRFQRGCRKIASADTDFFSSATTSNGTAAFNCIDEQPAEFEQRRSLETELTVASAVFGGVTTVVTWSGSPTLSSISGAVPNQNLKFLTGPLVGQEFPITAQDNSAKTTTVTGDASAAVAGNSGRPYLIFHADAFQFAQQVTGAPVVENIFFQRCIKTGVTIQPIFCQMQHFTGAGTITTVGAALECSTDHGLVVGEFVRPTNGSQAGEYSQVVSVDSSTTATLDHAFTEDQTGRAWIRGKTAKDIALQCCVIRQINETDAISQWQDGNQHHVYRLCTILGTNATLRNGVTQGFGLRRFGSYDSIWELMNADTGFPSVDFDSDNNHFLSGTGRGTNSSTGEVTFDDDFRPTDGLSKTVSDPKRFPFDLYGRRLTPESLIGAAQP